MGKVTYVKSDTAAGIVVQQSAKAWYDVPQFTEIDFEVSGGPSYSGNGSSIPTEEDMKPAETEPPVQENDETSAAPEEDSGSGLGSGSGLFKDIEEFYENGGTEEDWFNGFFFEEE